MDPFCHTLVGAALAKGGCDRWTPRATAVLMFAANAPDVDIVATLVGENLAWRRGVSHGVPALLVWPFLIAAAALLFDRWRPVPGEPPVRFGPVAAISAVGVLTHSVLDYLNNYGMRWLMPFRDRWFYGDSLFIVDPWLYLVLGLGLYLAGQSRRAGHHDPARPLRIALAIGLVYLGGMMAGTTAARAIAVRSLGHVDRDRLMVTALPVTPFRKQLIADDGGHYRIGTVDLLTRTTRVDSTMTRDPRFAEAVAALKQSAPGRALLRWSRYPVVREVEGGRLRFFDLRYTDGRDPSWASLDVNPIEPTLGPLPATP